MDSNFGLGNSLLPVERTSAEQFIFALPKGLYHKAGRRYSQKSGRRPETLKYAKGSLHNNNSRRVSVTLNEGSLRSIRGRPLITRKATPCSDVTTSCGNKQLTSFGCTYCTLLSLSIVPLQTFFLARAHSN